jgi:hypothetical protein
MAEDRTAPTEHPHWVPSFGMLMVVALAVLVILFCGANVLFWLYLPPIGPEN